MASKNEHGDNVIVLDAQALMVPLSIVFGAIIIAAVLFFTRGDSPTSNPNVAGTGTNQPTVNANDPAPQGNAKTTVSIDDDPVKGSRDAKVAIVEFSDFECPFCKTFHQQTLPQIIQEYVDSGKVLLVYRDFPLSFHNPLATNQAMATQCVFEAKGDDAAFTFIEAIYNTTNSNNGMTLDAVFALGDLVGVSASDLQTCVESGKFAAEVEKDMSDGIAAGVSGTPGFVVGILGDDGIVDGEIVSGAQPFSVFQSVIESYLAK